MKKHIATIAVLAACFLSFLPTHGYATLYSYSGVTQGTIYNDTTLYDIYFNLTISDRLWDPYNERYVMPVQGQPLPQGTIYGYKVYDWYVDVISVEQFSGHSGAYSGYPEMDGSLYYFDELGLRLDSGGVCFMDSTLYWADFQGHSSNYFWDPNSPGYGQLAPILGFFSFHNDGLENPFGANFSSSPLLLIRNPNPVGSEPVPEPSTMLLLGTGLIGLAGWGRRKFKK